jgi:hypothetical protein
MVVGPVVVTRHVDNGIWISGLFAPISDTMFRIDLRYDFMALIVMYPWPFDTTKTCR